MMKTVRIALPMAAALLLGGCGGVGTPAGPEEHDSQHVELDKSER